MTIPKHMNPAYGRNKKDIRDRQIAYDEYTNRRQEENYERRVKQRRQEIAGICGLIAMITKDSSLWNEAKNVHEEASHYLFDVYKPKTKVKPLKAVMERHKSFVDELEDLTKKSGSGIVFGRGNTLHVKDVFKGKWERFKQKYGIRTNGDEILEATGKPKELNADLYKSKDPKIQALKFLKNKTEKLTPDFLDFVAEKIHQKEPVKNEHLLLIEHILYQMGEVEASLLFECSDPPLRLKSMLDAISSRERYEDWIIHSDWEDNKRLLMQGDTRRIDPKLLTFFRHLVRDGYKGSFGHSNPSNTFMAWNSEIQAKLEALNKAQKNALDTGDDRAKTYLNSILTKVEDGKELTENQQIVLSQIFKRFQMEAEIESWGLPQVEDDANEGDVEISDNPQVNALTELLGMKGVSSNIEHTTLITTAINTINSGGNLTEDVLKSIRHLMYRNYMKDQASMFKTSHVDTELDKILDSLEKIAKSF